MRFFTPSRLLSPPSPPRLFACYDTLTRVFQLRSATKVSLSNFHAAWNEVDRALPKTVLWRDIFPYSTGNRFPTLTSLFEAMNYKCPAKCASSSSTAAVAAWRWWAQKSYDGHEGQLWRGRSVGHLYDLDGARVLQWIMDVHSLPKKPLSKLSFSSLTK